MIQELAVYAIKTKLGFPGAIMTGKYELAYTLGVLDKKLNRPASENDRTLGAMKKEMEEELDRSGSTEERFLLLKDMIINCAISEAEVEETLDNDGFDLYRQGYNEENFWN